MGEEWDGVLEPGPVLAGVKYSLMSEMVKHLSVKEKRQIYKMWRTGEYVDENTFLPEYGITIGEYSFFSHMAESGRKNGSNRRGDAEEEEEDADEGELSELTVGAKRKVRSARESDKPPPKKKVRCNPLPKEK